MKRLLIGLALAATTLAAFRIAGPAPMAAASDAAGGAHPHFEDQGVITWSTKLADAQRAAKEHKRLILIEYGREA